MDRNAQASGRAARWRAWLKTQVQTLSALPLRARLLASFALIVALMLAFGAFALMEMAGLNRDTRDIAEGWLPRSQLAAAMKIEAVGVRVAQFQFIAVGEAVESEDGYVGVVDKAAQAESDIARHLQRLDEFKQRYAALPADEAQQTQFAAFVEAWSNYQASSELFLGMAKDGLRDVAMSMITEQARIEFEAANAALDVLIVAAGDGATAASANSASNYGKARQLALLALLLAAALGAGAALWLVRQTMRQLGGDPAAVQHVVERIAVGDLGVQIRLAPGDRSSLLAATARMQGELQRLATELQQLHAEHRRGMLAHRIDAGSFAGVYGELAVAVNALAASHIEVSEQVVAVIQRYALGDFAVDMPQLPGEQARISAAVDGVKRQLGAIKDETLRLADAAGRGEFSLRGDAAQFQFAFRDIIDGLNRLMGTAEQGLQAVGTVLAGLAAGDLTQRMHGQFHGRFAELQGHAEHSLQQLGDIVQRIQQSAELIESASGEIAAGNQDLSARTEAQASNLEETASSIEELAGVVGQNAANAREAKQLAANAGDVARRGGAVVEQVVGTMGAIAESSKRIADIIGVIDGIAFQTNILALNAAVEAARAGEQGRGFAVVASEVRALAQRSADAAKEIKQLITESVNKVASGADLVDDAGRTMREIVGAVQRVDNIMADIANGSAEQSAGIAQVNQAIAQIDGATQQNAALVEEAAAAARSLNEQAAELRQAAGSFVLSRTD
ncbi:MAG TPA: methyl-accepting chemotaxis protein [Arenimonas sp.]|nr:methyl-accepting chemotaxis protein [Arenimonas sp.]